MEQGRGAARVDYADHEFESPCLLCLSTYQKAKFECGGEVSGWLLRFHANFFCIETHHHAVGCNGVLFNEVYEVPIVRLDADSLDEFRRLMLTLEQELRLQDLAQAEVLMATLKILLIKATRMKIAQQGTEGVAATDRPEPLRQLRELLETHYHQLHSPGEYARRLGISPRTLSDLVRTHFHKTLAELIRDRVMKHARWQLLHTLKPVKQVALEVGYEDEFYFSRLFKRALGCSPQVYREQETLKRKGANLSM
ncbi:helix-turn-helix transcriptional regulator [Roseimicrobium gellanilyticum]|nr:AraC family transcriptional regulator [Roseimicrobium gellanilyticum]